MAKDMMGKIAIWAFIIGALIALLVGLWQAYTIEQNEQPVFTTDMGGWIAWILAILGAIVGLLAMLGKGTITKAEVPAFLMAGENPGMKEGCADLQCFKRSCETDDLVGTFVFLASNDSDFVTGQTLECDGGQVCW